MSENPQLPMASTRGKRSSRHRAAVLLALVSLSAASLPLHQAVAQDTAPAKPNCQAPASPSQGQAGGSSSGAQLSQKLDNCGSVLEAPKTGDSDIVTPAPSTGSGRVIEPGALPPNANPSNGSGG